MEHHVNWLTALLNHLIGKQVGDLMVRAGLHPHNPAEPFQDYVVMSVVVLLVSMVFVLWLKRRLSVDRPGPAQQIAEFLITNPAHVGIRDLLEQNAGHQGRDFVPLVGTISVFILVSNLISVIPAFVSPTAFVPVPLGCALVTFVYFNWQGIRHSGLLGYLKHLWGPVWWLGPLILPVEAISYSARILSLTVRLYANIFASELLYATFLGILLMPTVSVGEKNTLLGILIGIFPAIFPIAFVLLHIFVAVIQTFVFTILPSIYIGQVVAEEH